jgi:hypothetical protein
LNELPGLAAEIVKGTFFLKVEAQPLSRIEEVWARPLTSDERVVITP